MSKDIGRNAQEAMDAVSRLFWSVGETICARVTEAMESLRPEPVVAEKAQEATLLPCPFCGTAGGNMKVERDPLDAVPTFAVFCPQCDMRGPVCFSEADAQSLWCRRA